MPPLPGQSSKTRFYNMLGKEDQSGKGRLHKSRVLPHISVIQNTFFGGMFVLMVGKARGILSAGGSVAFFKATSQKVVPRMAVYVAGAMAGIAMAGWVLHVHVLTSVLPGYVSMKANTAIAFLLLVGALYCATWPRNFIWQQG